MSRSPLGNRTITATENKLARFRDQLTLPGMTNERQSKLFGAHVAVVGLGGAGSACAFHLAQAGISQLTLVDSDTCVITDLTAYHLLYPSNLGQFKANAISTNLQSLFPDLTINSLVKRFDAHNAEQILANAHVVCEDLENWQDKLLVSDTCMQMAIPLIHCGMMAYNFHVFSMIPARSACLRCVFASLGLEDFPLKAPGVLGAIAGLAGSFQAAEAIKLIAQLGTISGNHLLRFDILRSEFDDMTELVGRPDCPDCGRWG